MEDVEDERKSLLDIWRMIEKMNESISDLGKNLISRMNALEGKFEAFVEKRMGVLDEKLSDRIRMVEVDLKGMKETKPTNVPVDSTSNNNEEDEAHSHQPSWMVEMKETSKDEFPVPQVVKKVYSVSNKKKKSETEVSADLPLCEQTYATQDLQKNLVGDVLKKLGRKNVRPAAVKVEKEKGKRPAADGSELEDITDKVVALDTKMASSSEDTWDDPQQQLVSKRLDVTLTRLGEHLKNLDGDTSLAKRVPQLAKSQKYLFVGNSTVKRIISSNVSYDHLKPAEDAKLQKLMDFLKLDEEAPLQTGNADVRFYWQIMTPRLDWPSFDYGWLKDFHMGAAMKMFRNRFIREPSQYPNQRIAFLDQDMLSSLLRDFDQFALSRRNFLFRDMYLEHYNGLAPVDSQTKKKWYVDVDHLYACLFVNKNHWVALDINLPARTIYVYDSIPSLVKDSDLVKECIALRRMIPALLSQAIPPQVRKKSYAMLEVKRMTQGVSLNKYPGDCGVFALKNIECLALGKKFDGICDENIPAIPIKLACELFDEVGESLGHRMTTILSQPNQFVIPHLIDESLTSLMSDE